MADIFVDRIVNNHEVERHWFETTKDLILLNGFTKMFDKFLDAHVEVADYWWAKNNYPKRIFEGKANLKITEIADRFGLEPKKSKMRLCPFHKDTNLSLSLSDEKGVFNCFGCGVKGNIITFNAMLKGVNHDK